jgi:hypothetical protein
MENFEQELSNLLNKYGKDAEANMADIVLAQFISNIICVLAKATENQHLLSYVKKEIVVPEKEIL